MFDLDDTLYPERQFVLSGFRAVANWVETEVGHPADDAYDAFVKLHDRGVRGDIFDRWLAGSHRVGLEVGAMVDVYRTHEPTVDLFDGVGDLLLALKPHVSLGLLSDGYLIPQQRKLSALSIGQVFDSVVFSDSFGREFWKPSQRPFQTALDELQVAAPEAVYVADNPRKDFLGARSLGMATIWARHSGGDYARLLPPGHEYAADETTESISALSSLLLDQYSGVPR